MNGTDRVGGANATMNWGELLRTRRGRAARQCRRPDKTTCRAAPAAITNDAVLPPKGFGEAWCRCDIEPRCSLT